MNIRRIIPIIAIVAMACLALTACMRDDNAGVQTAPTATADYYPGNGGGTDGLNNGAGGASDNRSGANNAANGGNTGAAGNTASSSTGALGGVFDWANNASQIETAIDRISEIADSRVVVTNSTALVAVKFDSVYKGQLTERIREMVAAEVMKADPAIQTVAVTSEDGDVQKVYALSDQIRSGRTADELSGEINAIVRNATTLR